MTDPSAVPSLDSFTGTLTLAGAGKMGGAMLAGWLAGGLAPERVAVIEPSPSDEIRALAQRGLKLNPVADNLGVADIVVLAVKPQTFGEAAPALRALVAPSTLVLSIMAGRTIGGIAKACGGAVVRAMPNTPAAIGRGMTVAVGAPTVTPAQRALATALLAATGRVEWVEDESLMDAVTAVSGSGPAYVFLLAEELARAGIAAGLPEALAMTLARETMAGAGELMHRSPLDAATLRQNVTSPGGTTAAALAVLMGEPGLRELMARAVAEATRRSRDLAS
ncbi:MAG: pyrroline-5-carboxylate reductase [Xanthobacteraceae bacterium]|nr:MAG: pyrroline-5-carboxylate reductase [Xanthobacteraceae bacterium]